jgi:3-hydroxybenzoate 6-monooxygenase
MDANAKHEPVLIVGGGIGGLAAALALARKGFRVQLLEQAAEFKEVGAGIQLGPNVFRMFEILGLTQAINRDAVFPDSLLMRDSITGEEVARVVLDDRFRQKYKHPYAVTHRADLHAAILDACQRSKLIDLRPLQKVIEVEEKGDAVVVRTEDSRTYRGVALIGCDGLWSQIRARIVGDGEPIVSGHIAYRAVIPPSEMPEHLRLNTMVIWAGEKTHFVHYPLRRGELFNLVAVFHSDRYQEGWDSFGDPAELQERFADKCEEVRTLLNKIESWRMWVLCDRTPIKEWSRGRLTLLGDAAHPMLQYLAQGACMAIEDAVCLAHEADRAKGDFAAAFAAYQAARYLRTGRVQIMARVYGEFYHASGVARELRNAMLGSRTSDEAIDSMAWLYGEEPHVPTPDTAAAGVVAAFGQAKVS